MNPGLLVFAARLETDPSPRTDIMYTSRLTTFLTRACRGPHQAEPNGQGYPHWLLGPVARCDIFPAKLGASSDKSSSLIEWKVDMDSPDDTHRHLSHLIGLYPGYAVTNFNASVQGTAINYTHQQVIDAATTSLIHRGNGTGPDADSGWEKVWRAACWAQLGNASEFYHELSVGATSGPDWCNWC